MKANWLSTKELNEARAYRKEREEESRLRDAEEANRYYNPDSPELDIMETY